MSDALWRAWRDAREKDLAAWPLDELVKLRDRLGIKVDPRRDYSLADLIATEELARLRDPEDEDPMGTALPGAVLEQVEDDAADEMVILDYPPADVTGVPWDIANPEDIKMTILKDNNPYDISTSSGWFIYEVILPEVMRKFFSKNADYGDQHRTGLGIKAEFVGLHRKFAKLKAFFWDNQEMNHETGEEMLQDVIGACLLMLDLMNLEETRRRAVVNEEDMPDPAAY